MNIGLIKEQAGVEHLMNLLFFRNLTDAQNISRLGLYGMDKCPKIKLNVWDGYFKSQSSVYIHNSKFILKTNISIIISCKYC